VAVGRRLGEDRLAELQVPDDGAGPQVEVLHHEVAERGRDPP
jgi:hypothetical protein